MTILHLIRLNGGAGRVKSRNYWCVKGNSKPQIPIRPSPTVLWERLADLGLLVIDDDSDWQEEKGVTWEGGGWCCKRRGYSGARRSGEKEEDEDTDLQEEGRGGGGRRLLARRAAQVPQGGLHKVGKVMIRWDMDTIGKEGTVFIIDAELKSPKRPWNRAKG